MEPEVVRTDPSSDIRPKTKKHAPQRLVYILISIFGAFCIIAGAYSRSLLNESWVPEIFLAFGVAVATPGILSYLYRKYLLDDIKTELEQPANEFKEKAYKKLEESLSEILKKYREEIILLESAHLAGLYGIYQSRTDALRVYLDYIKSEKDNIIIIGSSLLGLLQDKEKEYIDLRNALRNKIIEKVNIKFLLTHPMVADLRARQENRKPKAISEEILISLRILINDWKVPPSAIKLYKGTPTCFSIKTSNAMLINTYPYMKEAYASPCLIAIKGGQLYQHYNNSHFKAWDSDMAEDVGDISVHEGMLDTYSTRIYALIGE